jgi:hypothetical protein
MTNSLQREQRTEGEKFDFSVYFYANAITLQALTGPERSRRLRLPDFKTISI